MELIAHFAEAIVLQVAEEIAIAGFEFGMAASGCSVILAGQHLLIA